MIVTDLFLFCWYLAAWTSACSLWCAYWWIQHRSVCVLQKYINEVEKTFHVIKMSLKILSEIFHRHIFFAKGRRILTRYSTFKSKNWLTLLFSRRKKRRKGEEEEKGDRAEKKQEGASPGNKQGIMDLFDIRPQSGQPIRRGTRPNCNYFWQPLNSQTYCPGSVQQSHTAGLNQAARARTHIKTTDSISLIKYL